jgi:hypothetical protein
MASSFMIGTTAEDLTSLDELTVPLDDPLSDFSPYFEVVELADLSGRGMGTPYATWTLTLTADQRNQMKTFCTGASEELYIQTKKDDDSFGIFSATLIWPKEPTRKIGIKFSVAFMFTNLVEVEGS